MKRLFASSLFVFTVACASICLAQPPAQGDFDGRDERVMAGSPSMSSELWFYLQEQRRHDDPAQAVRRKAEFKADQRAKRIAASNWYGFSNSRPLASGVPIMGNYASIANGAHGYAFRWFGPGAYPLRTARY